MESELEGSANRNDSNHEADTVVGTTPRKLTATGKAIDIGTVDDSKLKKKLIADSVWCALDMDRNGTIEYYEFATRMPA